MGISDMKDLPLQRTRGGAQKTNYLYLVTYLCRVEGDAYTHYDSKGILQGVLKKTHLIERDCIILAAGLQEVISEIEATDDCFIRILKSEVVPNKTVVHILDRATNYVEKA